MYGSVAQPGQSTSLLCPTFLERKFGAQRTTIALSLGYLGVVGSNPIGVIMEFCPKCKQLIIPVRNDLGNYNLICNNCNLNLGFARPLKESEEIKNKVIGEGVVPEVNEYANYKNKCKKCGYGKAQIIDMGVFYSDEDNLIFLKCGKCGYSERIGRKTS